jgi:hypothetical protein
MTNDLDQLRAALPLDWRPHPYSSRCWYADADGLRYIAKRFTSRRFDLDVGKPQRGCDVCHGGAFHTGRSPAEAVARWRGQVSP